MKGRKPNGYFTKMNDNDLIKYISENHKGKKISQIRKKDNRAYHIAQERGLIGSLVERKILYRAIRQRYWSDMSDDELINYIAEHHKGEKISQLGKSEDSKAYVTALKRGLIETLVEKGILVRSKKKDRPYEDISDEELTSIIKRENYGETLTQFRENNYSKYCSVRERNLLSKLIKQGILVRKIVEGNLYKNMSDDELTDFITKRYSSKNISTFSDGKDGLAYYVAKKRGLIKTLVEKGILVRAKREDGLFKRMSDEELIRYFTENHNGETLGKISESKDDVAYQIARERGIIEKLVEQGIVKRERRKNGYFENMSDEELINYIAEHHKGEKISQLHNSKDIRAYMVLMKRGLIETLVEKGILVRAQPRYSDALGVLETILDEGSMK